MTMIPLQTFKVGDIVYMTDIFIDEPDYDEKELYINKMYTIDAILVGCKDILDGGSMFKGRFLDKITIGGLASLAIAFKEKVRRNYTVVHLRPVFEQDDERPFYLSQIELDVVADAKV